MTPIIIDVNGNGLSLTDAATGVQFDLNADGQSEQTAWTAPNSDDAFLALDMNGNGTIDNGAELFGNATPQPGSGLRNGFNALAEYDTPAKGGNSDGQIDSRDAIFEQLRLWKDLNHNGISEAGELYKLPELGVASISLTYHRTGESDRFGNRLRYRARVNQGIGSGSSRWAIDVSLAGL
jgi:hypothetical protein